MRFGKRNKSWAAAGRRLIGEHPENDSGAIATEERNALLGSIPEMPAAAPASDEPALTGDPTQHLLTALGRFQRQVAKAENGVSQSSWCDECMNQLIRGIEIAHMQGWEGVQEALTDTARVLQSYEEAGCAVKSVPFLQDSYEILCLMVGDLIVDNVRSGVIQKWRDRYQHAVDDLAKAGLTLVQDDEADEIEEETPSTASPIAPESPTPEPEEEWKWDASNFGDAHAFDDGPAFDARNRVFAIDDDDDVIMTEQIRSETLDEIRDEQSLEETEETAEDISFSPLPEEASDEVSPFAAPPAENAFDRFEMDNLPSLTDVIEDTPATPKMDAPSQSDLLPESESGEGDFLPEEPLETIAPAAEQTPALEPAEASTPVIDSYFEETSAEGEDAFEEDTAPAEDLAPEQSDIAEESVITEEPATEEAGEEAPETPEIEAREEAVPEQAEAAPAEVADDSPEGLLHTAQLAMARGAVADAKMFALRLAANMAQLEVAESERQVASAETHLAETQQATLDAEIAVEQAEEAVGGVESNITERQSDFGRVRDQAGALRERMSGIEGVIADLDEQIRALEAKRADEVANLEMTQGELDEVLSEESRLQTELEALAEAESAAQSALEEAQKRVAELKQAGVDAEAAIEAAKHELALRKHSSDDIARTLGDIGGKPEPSGGAQ